MTEAKAPPGRIVLFGSGETSASGRVIHDRLMKELQPPIVMAILETPAGFQPNSEHVAREVGEFTEARLNGDPDKAQAQVSRQYRGRPTQND